jgi:Protein of unknown function (DUF3800)
MLKAYVDDSHVGDRESAVYVLAGWVAPVTTWRKFSDEWDAILWMSPRIRYFKFDEAMGLSGEFQGISEQSRDEKLRLLTNLLGEHAPLGIASILPTRIYEGVCRNHGSHLMRNPYSLLFFGIVGRLAKHYEWAGATEKIEFIFDHQPSGKMNEIQRGWQAFLEAAPQNARALLYDHPPSFLDDKVCVVLQAADLHAGLVHLLESAPLLGREVPQFSWGQGASKLTRVFWMMDEEWAEGAINALFGYRPVRFTYSFGYGYLPLKRLS